MQSDTPSRSESVSATPQPQGPGAVLSGSFGQQSVPRGKHWTAWPFAVEGPASFASGVLLLPPPVAAAAPPVPCAPIARAPLFCPELPPSDSPSRHSEQDAVALVRGFVVCDPRVLVTSSGSYALQLHAKPMARSAPLPSARARAHEDPFVTSLLTTRLLRTGCRFARLAA
jgi:hypothetical protein